MKFPDSVDTVSAFEPSGCIASVENAPVTSKSPADEPNLSFLTGLPILFSPYMEPNVSSTHYAV